VAGNCAGAGVLLASVFVASAEGCEKVCVTTAFFESSVEKPPWMLRVPAETGTEIAGGVSPTWRPAPLVDVSVSQVFPACWIFCRAASPVVVVAA
jgi:hypothetical protein